MTLISILVMVFCFLMSGYFSTSETALFSLSNPTIKRWLQRGDRLQKLAARLLQEQHRTLVVILVGNNFVNVLGTLLFTHLFTTHVVTGAQGPLLAALLVTAILLVFCEVTPKSLALVKALAIAPKVAPGIYILGRLCAPLVSSLHTVTVQLLKFMGGGQGSGAISVPEFETFIHNGERVGVFDAGEARLLSRILGLRECPASRIMIPRVDVRSADVTLAPPALEELIRRHCHRRLPVVKGDFDHLVGVLDTRTFLTAGPKQRAAWASGMLLKPLYIPATTPLFRVLARMRQADATLAFVVDEFGGLAGMLTYEDVFEELVGEVHDEFDSPQWHMTPIGPRHWRMSGLTPLHVLAKELRLELHEALSDTVGGLLAERLGRLPVVGDYVLLSHYRLEVRRVHRRRVLEVDVLAHAALASHGKKHP
jgi:putative hemolysin